MGSELIAQFLKLVVGQAPHKLAQTAAVKAANIIELYLLGLTQSTSS